MEEDHKERCSVVWRTNRVLCARALFRKYWPTKQPDTMSKTFINARWTEADLVGGEGDQAASFGFDWSKTYRHVPEPKGIGCGVVPFPLGRWCETGGYQRTYSPGPHSLARQVPNSDLLVVVIEVVANLAGCYPSARSCCDTESIADRLPFGFIGLSIPQDFVHVRNGREEGLGGEPQFSVSYLGGGHSGIEVSAVSRFSSHLLCRLYLDCSIPEHRVCHDNELALPHALLYVGLDEPEWHRLLCHYWFLVSDAVGSRACFGCGSDSYGDDS